MTVLQPPCQAGPPPQQSLRARQGRASWCPARSRAGGGGRKEEPVLLPPKLTTDQRVPAFLSFLPRTPPSLCSWRVLGFSWKISGKRRELCSRLCHRGAGDVKIILILVTLGPFQRRETAHQYDEPAPGREGKAGWSAQGTPWSFPLRTPGLKGQSHGKSPTSAFFFKLKGSRFCHHKILMLETCPLYTGADLNLRDRVLDEVGKNSLLLYQAKGDTAGLCPQNPVS